MKGRRGISLVPGSRTSPLDTTNLRPLQGQGQLSALVVLHPQVQPPGDRVPLWYLLEKIHV